MFEGAKKTETAGGDIISDNKSLDSNRYGNDGLKNLMILHIPTGKIKDISFEIHQTVPSRDEHPSVRGFTCIPRGNGDVDMYMWIHNPRRNPIAQAEGHPYGQVLADNEITCEPLYRLHIPANPDSSNPFANVTGGHTNIICDPLLLTTPDENPYDIYQANTSKDLKYQYEIQAVTWDLTDSVTGEKHYFMMSYNKGSRDYVTQRVFEIHFDESDPDAGSIIPVAAHADSWHAEYASGYPVKKKDINGVERCFLFGSPCGLSEVYFVGDRYNRTTELRNYKDYTPLGDRIIDPNGGVNGIGQDLIIGKGVVDNWYKSTTLNPQFITQAPIDNDDYFSNIIIWYQSAYGVCTLNIQDLGTVDRSDEVHLENNYQGSELELSSLMIETKTFYMSYIQDSSSKNLQRFSTKQIDSHSHGSLYYFDYKADYKYDTKNDASITNDGEEATLYNSTRAYDNNGNLTDQLLFKRPILEVRPNYETGRVEVHAIPVGMKQRSTKKEIGYHESFSGESVVKFGDVFVCSGASKSHSSVLEPKIHIFDPNTNRIQRISNTEVNATSLISSPQHGLVIGSSYGVDSNDQPTPIYFTSMTANNQVQNDRKTARTLRKLYAVTGDSVAADSNTWTEDPAQSAPAAPNLADFDSNESEWDSEV
jgi:hypothetical protein